MDFARSFVFVFIQIAGAAFIMLARPQSEAQPGATHGTAAAEAIAHCSLHRADDHFAGACGKLFGQEPEMTLRPAPHTVTGVWRDDIRPISVWAGDMTDKGYANAPLELEIYTGDWGILRTAYGWFAVSKFSSSNTTSFDLDHSREIQPNSLDGKIIRTAAGILSTEAAWNRKDNRNCPATATRWSIYCAMEKAIVDVTGGFHHRRPAMEVVRKIIEERTATRNYRHRFMDYNNDPTTHLSDVQTLFKEALGPSTRGPFTQWPSPEAALGPRSASCSGCGISMFVRTLIKLFCHVSHARYRFGAATVILRNFNPPVWSPWI